MPVKNTLVFCLAPAGAWFLAAAAAPAAEMNVVVLNLKLMGFDIWPRDAVQARILDINNAPAA